MAKTVWKDLNFKGLDFPVKLKDIKHFEKQNKNIPGINTFLINDQRVTEKDC